MSAHSPFTQHRHDAIEANDARVTYNKRAPLLGVFHISQSGVVGLILYLSLFSFLAGCQRLRLPAIDPSGQRIFNPLPATTSIALPGSAGEGRLGNCLQRLGDPLNLRPFSIPEPAFTEPVAPPKCLAPRASAPQTSIAGQSNEPCVPSSPCATDCKNGPPAVLYGNECMMRDLCKLPRRGRRGCILLSPQKIVAPVGGEVILLSGICGTEGYLEMGEPLEWMLTPESVGTFIQVGDDDPGMLHKLARIKKARKQDPSYAHGVTSTKRTLITRGNLNPNDDVQLEKGQTWISVSSPGEGTSRVTVLAPESDCWDQRKATATIYWVDARWQYPGTQIVPAGTPVELSTRVTRSEGTLPARGWKVRYQILQPELATFAGTASSDVVEATVGDDGNATVQLIPTPGTAGTTAVAMEIIRPGGETDNIPSLTISRGQTFVQWSAPQLALRAGAPRTATFGQPFQAIANVSNPGDQPATNVRVIMQIPTGVQATSRDEFATNAPSAIVWEIPEIPAKTQLDLFADVRTEQSIGLRFEARADGELFAEDAVSVDVFRPSIVLSVVPQSDRVEVGQPVTFDIDVRNTGDRELTNLRLAATGDSGMLHESNERSVKQLRQDGPLAAGQTWPVAVTFIPTDAGQRCVEFEVTADGGQRDTAQSCVIVINKPAPTPAVTVTLSGPSQQTVGETKLYRGIVANTGRIPLENVRVVMVYDPQLRPSAWTADLRDENPTGPFLLRWNIPLLEPQTSQTFEAEFDAIGSNQRSNLVMTAASDQGARDSKRFEFQILPPPAGTGPLNNNAQPPISLPPAEPNPSIPGPVQPGPSPIPSPERTQPRGPVAPPLAESPKALELDLFGPNIAVLVNEPIRYRLSVRNPSARADSNVSIKFNLPDGVSVSRVSHERSPELSGFEVNAGEVYLQDIRSMRPGETIDYEIVLISNQPQEFQILAEAVSRGTEQIAQSRVLTRVVP